MHLNWVAGGVSYIFQWGERGSENVSYIFQTPLKSLLEGVGII